MVSFLIIIAFVVSLSCNAMARSPMAAIVGPSMTIFQGNSTVTNLSMVVTKSQIKDPVDITGVRRRSSTSREYCYTGV